MDILNNILHKNSITNFSQKSKEWHQQRNNLITASDITNVLSSEKSRNSYILKKCRNFNNSEHEREHSMSSNSIHINNPMMHGILFEPITLKMYCHFEFKNKEYELYNVGCLIHDEYSFIGASPDGIIWLPKENILKCIEIKNPTTRIIDVNKIPKSYYDQMQLQMEVCNISICDFIQTKFYVYLSKEEFENDINVNENTYRGIIENYYNDEIENRSYNYSPISTNLEELLKWKNRNEFHSCFYIYWKLETYSCIQIERNKQWFDKHFSIIQQTWNIILEERNSPNIYECRQNTIYPKKICTTNLQDSEKSKPVDNSESIDFSEYIFFDT